MSVREDVLRALRLSPRPLNRYGIQRLTDNENGYAILRALDELRRRGLVVKIEDKGQREARWQAVPSRRTLPGGVIKAEFLLIPPGEKES